MYRDNADSPLGVEADGAVIASLNDAPGSAGNGQASAAWHKDLLVLESCR